MHPYLLESLALPTKATTLSWAFLQDPSACIPGKRKVHRLVFPLVLRSGFAGPSPQPDHHRSWSFSNEQKTGVVKL